jgi:hypothetical protein
MLWDRRAKLTIAPPVRGSLKTAKTQNAIVIEQLRVTFKITKTLRKEPNHSKIIVYNLAESTRKQLQGKGVRIWLEAGYAPNPGTAATVSQIFVGDARFVEHHRDPKGIDWVSEFEVGDGERIYAHGRVNASFKGGTSRAAVLKTIVQQSGWDLGNLDAILPDLQQPCLNGYSAYGPAWQEIDRILTPMGLSWSIQDGAIQVLPKAGYTPVAAIQLDADHGLIGAPEFGSPPTKARPRTLKVKSLLQAQIVPGRRINLVSAAHRGVITVRKVEHDADTHGKQWYSEIEALTA